MLEALQNNTRLSLDQILRFISLRSYAAVQVFAEALEKSGTSDSSAVIETLKEVEMQDSAIGEFSFSESGDILGAGDELLPSSPNADGSQVCPSLLIAIEYFSNKQWGL